MDTTGGHSELSFERDVKPLFRERDRATMIEVANFDLWKRADVADKAEAIVRRLEDGSMPCDAPWPPERVATFRQWMTDGMPA